MASLGIPNTTQVASSWASVAAPPGVHKHRSIEDAQALREQWQAEDFRLFWERQRALSGGAS